MILKLKVAPLTSWAPTYQWASVQFSSVQSLSRVRLLTPMSIVRLKSCIAKTRPAKVCKMPNKPKPQTNPRSWQASGYTPGELMTLGPSCHFPYNPASDRDLLRSCVRSRLWAPWQGTKKQKTWPQLSRTAHIMGTAKHASMKIVAGIKRIRGWPQKSLLF